MRILAVASQKGGSGKTLIAAHLAVRAAATGPGPVALVEIDRLAPLAEWAALRGGESPMLTTSTPERLAADLEILRLQGVRMVVIDTPPGSPATMRQAIALSELILIPTRTAAHDRNGAVATAAACDGAGKPVLFVVNAAPTDSRAAYDCAVALSPLGSVAPTTLHARPDYASALDGGTTVMEADPEGASAGEIAGLWLHVGDRLERSFRRTVFRVPGHGVPAARGAAGFGRRVMS